MAAVTLERLKDPKPVVGEAHVRGQHWYLQRSIQQELVIDIVNLVKDMMNISICTVHVYVHVHFSTCN